LEIGGHRDFVDRTDKGDIVECTDGDDCTGELPALLGLYSANGCCCLGKDKPGFDAPHFKGEAVGLCLLLEDAISKPLRGKSLSFPDLAVTPYDILSSVALHAKLYTGDGVLLFNDAVLRFVNGALLSTIDGASDLAIFLHSTLIWFINSSNLIILSSGLLIVVPSSQTKLTSSRVLSVPSRASRHERDIVAESYDLRVLIVLQFH
jgi:hypothetical protein